MPEQGAPKAEGRNHAARQLSDSLKREMLNFLHQSQIQAELEGRLSNARKELSTSINQAAKLVGTTTANLRYQETLGFLSPKRTIDDDETQGPGEAAKQSGKRLYSLRDLAQLLIARTLLDKGYRTEEIAGFLQAEQEVVDRLAETVVPVKVVTEAPPLKIPEWIRGAEKALFFQTMLPRVLFLATSLFFGQKIRSDVGLILPIKTEETAWEPIRVCAAGAVPRLGEMLIGWYSPTHPFSLFLVKQADPSLLEVLRRYDIQPLEWSPPAPMIPTNLHIVREMETDLPINTDEAAQQAAGRLLKVVQDSAGEWSRFLQSSARIYNSPNDTDPLLARRLMNDLLDMLIELGGREQDRTGKLKTRWRFATVFLPVDPSLPLQQRDLIARAKSKASPHVIEKTVLEYRRPKGLSLLAYQGSQPVNRPTIADGQLDITLDGEDVRSAVAVPLEGPGQPLGVLYITSDKEDAFPKDSQILVRLIARLLSEVVQGNQARDMVAEHLEDVIANPGQADPWFAEFAREEAFRQAIEKPLLEWMREQRPLAFEHLSLIAVNIDDTNTIERTFGDFAGKSLIRAVGRRIQTWINLHNERVQLYYMFSDRFYLLLPDIPLLGPLPLEGDGRGEDAAHQRIKARLDAWNLRGNDRGEDAALYAYRLWKTIGSNKLRIQVVPHSQQHPSMPGTTIGLEIKARVAVTSYTRETLLKMLGTTPKPANVRAKLVHTLEEALRLGRDQGGDNITLWHPETKQFVCHRPEEETDAAIKQHTIGLLQRADEKEQEQLKKYSEFMEQMLGKILDEPERSGPPESSE